MEEKIDELTAQGVAALLLLDVATTIMDNEIKELPTNSDHQRYYTEDVSEKSWNHLCHIIDLDENGYMYSNLIITQLSETKEEIHQIKLSMNEVDDLLSILLHSRMKYCAPKPEDLLATDLDDHPF